MHFEYCGTHPSYDLSGYLQTRALLWGFGAEDSCMLGTTQKQIHHGKTTTGHAGFNIKDISFRCRLVDSVFLDVYDSSRTPSSKVWRINNEHALRSPHTTSALMPSNWMKLHCRWIKIRVHTCSRDSDRPSCVGRATAAFKRVTMLVSVCNGHKTRCRSMIDLHWMQNPSCLRPYKKIVLHR